jgi:hypothetical protein
MLTEGIIALWASYSFTGPIFHTISLHALREVQVGHNKRLIQVWSLLYSIT